MVLTALRYDQCITQVVHENRYIGFILYNRMGIFEAVEAVRRVHEVEARELCLDLLHSEAVHEPVHTLVILFIHVLELLKTIIYININTSL